MLTRKISMVALSAMLSLSAVASPEAAEDSHDKSKRMGDMSDHGSANAAMGGHGHKAWVNLPHAYQELEYGGWSDQAAAERGKPLFEQQCAACHGLNGTGNGPVAASLAHPPADLTNHFHRMEGSGDGYLFWRITEGGQVEPFKSADSAMPAFGGVLSEAQRWDVLTYIHQAFHHSFKQQVPSHEGMSGMSEEMPHDDGGDRH